MQSRSTKLTVESLEDRCVPSTVAYGDFNQDGLADMATLSAPKTITVSLSNPDGSFTVSQVLTAPKPMEGVYVYPGTGDFNEDGQVDIYGVSSKANGTYQLSFWLGNGDGTFDYLEPWKTKPTHGGAW